MSRRPGLVQEVSRYVIAIVLSLGIVSQVRREERQPARGVPSVLARPSRDTVVAGGEVERTAAEVRKTVKETQQGFLGFDTNVYPGDEAMRQWKAESPYEWVGYYLPAPCHKDDSWSGKRETLERMGWGLAVIYVGQQVWSGLPSESSIKYITREIMEGGTRRTIREPAGAKACAAARVNAEHGTREAEDAIAKTAAEGFPRGTVIYLDLERVEVIPDRFRQYYMAWADRVIQDGRYHVGAYVHSHNAEQIYNDLKSVLAKRGVDEEPHMWIAKGRGFSPEAIPEDVGHAFARAWQGVLDVTRRYAGIKLPIDENVSDRPNPSAPISTTPEQAPTNAE